MSKKETEFDRYDRMKRLEKENDIQKRKQVQETMQSSFSDGTIVKKGGKQGGKYKSSASGGNRRNWSKDIDDSDEYDFG